MARHELTVTVETHSGEVLRLRIDVSQRRRAWWHVFVDNKRGDFTLRVSSNGGGVELVRSEVADVR
jgi:hypothetical protein